MTLKTFFTFSLMMLLSHILCAQEVTIYENSSEEPVGGVAIYNPSKTKSVVSDINGKADITIFENNEILIFKHLSHQTLRRVKGRIIAGGPIIYLLGNPQNLGQVVISASKFEQNQKDVPQKIISLKASDIQFANPQTSADLLQNTGQVFIQKSQLGGGSPIIRGFSTNRLLLSVDGVRMNNAIFRGGNIQNIISIDPFSVQNTEVILGAGSVIYGSDAIGGVMNFYTQKPILSYRDSIRFDINATMRYASSSNEKTGHIDFNLGFKKWAFLTNISYTDFDDLKMGRNGPDDFLRTEYIETIDGEDMVIQSQDPLIQKFTGYNQFNFLEKIRYEPSDNLNFNLGLHYSATSEYPRYDRLIQYQAGQLRSAEWKYGPQRWFLGNFQINHKSKKGLYDEAQFTAAYQNFRESRINRNFQSLTRMHREENVDALSLNLDFEKRISSINELFYGFEMIYNTVGSKGTDENVSTGEKIKAVSRYPDASDWQTAAVYFSFKYNPTEVFTFQTGLRYNRVIINSDFTENNTFLNLPFNEANLNTGAITGTAGINWNPNNYLGWKLNFSTAFRAPNIDDIGKVFDSAPGFVVVPNQNLKSERAYSGELGFVLNIDDFLNLDLSTYYTHLDDALVRRNFLINGQSEIEYDGEISTVQAIQNASESRIYGFEAGIKINFNKNLKLTSQYNVIGGTEKEVDGATNPVRHVVPNFGNAHFVWNTSAFKVDLFANYSKKLTYENLSLTERDKPYLYASDTNGNPYSPSWYTLNLRTNFNITNNISITATLENITDQRYRTYSSGIAASGQNFIISAKYFL